MRSLLPSSPPEIPASLGKVFTRTASSVLVLDTAVCHLPAAKEMGISGGLTGIGKVLEARNLGQLSLSYH